LPQEDDLTLKNWNWGDGDDFNWHVKSDRAVQEGDKLAIGCGDIEVIWTPGHSLEHICLYDQARKILFSGDHILPVITPHVGSDPNSSNNPLGNYIDSLKKIEQHDVDLILPGHEHVFTNLGERVQQILEHHEERVKDLLNILGSGEKTAYQIASKMTWVDVSGVVVMGENLSLFQRLGAMRETLAHLEFLQIEGKVERIIKEDVAFFRANMNNVSYT
jgi:glyoxylase-like metal-dependent hydrolase (beta-lactamase superfamily II)